MLIDELMERDENIKIVKVEYPIFTWEAGPILGFLGEEWIKRPIEAAAFDDLLNLLKVPTKYVKRCVETMDGPKIIEGDINFWLGRANISVLINNDVITQVFDGKRNYIPSYLINDHIIERMGQGVEIIHSQTDEDIFTATYIVKNMGVKILFSDCFTVGPRIDGVYWDSKSGTLYLVPVRDRKFRVADKDLSSFLVQVDEFCDLAMENIRNILPDLDNKSMINSIDWINQLISELRLNGRINNELRLLLSGKENNVVQLAQTILSKIDRLDVDMETIRNLQLAITNFVISGSFK